MTFRLRPDCATPSLQPHYRAFFTTTNYSAPVLRIGTITLEGPPLRAFPLHRNDRFPRSLQKPESSSRRLYAGCRLDSKQVSSRLVPGQRLKPGFDNISPCFDTSSAVRLRSSPCFTPDRSCPAFSLTLTTSALYQSSLRWFKACSCKPALRGPPSSFVKLHTL